MVGWLTGEAFVVWLKALFSMLAEGLAGVQTCALSRGPSNQLKRSNVDDSPGGACPLLLFPLAAAGMPPLFSTDIFAIKPTHTTRPPSLLHLFSLLSKFLRSSTTALQEQIVHCVSACAHTNTQFFLPHPHRSAPPTWRVHYPRKSTPCTSLFLEQALEIWTIHTWNDKGIIHLGMRDGRSRVLGWLSRRIQRSSFPKNTVSIPIGKTPYDLINIYFHLKFHTYTLNIKVQNFW